MSERKCVVPLTEGRMSKGGQNPPNMITARPPAPCGSGGAQPKPPEFHRWTVDHGAVEISIPSQLSHEEVEEIDLYVFQLIMKRLRRIHPAPGPLESSQL